MPSLGYLYPTSRRICHS